MPTPKSSSSLLCAVVPALAMLMGLVARGHAEVQLNGMFGDGMVVQRGNGIPVWGKASPGEEVTVEFAGQIARTVADDQGKFLAELNNLSAGGPHVMVVRGSNRIELKDVLIGDVWLCSGQSNMAFLMGSLRGTEYAVDLTAATDPMIRHAAIARTPSEVPADNTQVTWVSCDPRSVSNFTAVGYYFASKLREELKVPIGLIHSSWGGTSAESWAAASHLSGDADFAFRMRQQIANFERLPGQIEAFPALIRAWEEANGRTDPGNTGESEGWHLPEHDTSDWTDARLRQKWREVSFGGQGMGNGGIVWMRKEVNLPARVAGRDFRLDLGSLDDMYEVTYFNGEKLGESGTEPPEFYHRYRAYQVPGRLVREGVNVIAIRIRTPDGSGETLKRDPLALGFSGIGVTDIDAKLKVKIERAFDPLSKDAAAARPKTPKGTKHAVSSYLYNGMIHPIAPFGLRGVLWYQGEQDAGRAFAYRRLLPLMIKSWRDRWGQSDLPFVLVQLPNWRASGETNTEWAELREAQMLTSIGDPRVFITANYDVGESQDVHPRNKRDIGSRLALSALRRVYGIDVADTGPRYQSMRIDGAKIRITLNHAVGLRTRDGKPVGGLQIAGTDRVFVPAVAEIEGDELVVSAAGVADPRAVRYAFINDPVDANLINASGLPAFPFRTDDWPTSTVDRK